MMIETNLNNFFVFQTKNIGLGENSKDFTLTANNIFRQLHRRCFCGSNKVVHNGYKPDERIIVRELGLEIKRGQCSCRACEATWTVRPEEVDVWVKQLKQIINNEIISLAANKLSFEKTAEHIKNIYGKDISIEWVRRLYNRAIKRLKIKKPKDVSGYFNYDEQHIKENGEEVVRITIIDAIKKEVMLDKKFKNKGKETVTGAIKKALKKYEDKIRCFIVDMDRQYPFILEELYGRKVKVQWCIFHLFKLINKEFRDKVTNAVSDPIVKRFWAEEFAGYTDRYTQETPLTLSARLVFEQSYGGVDGDSASSTELFALLSALSGVPIYQGIAVTGSVSQKGEIQAVGGVSRKIEAFYDICKYKGLNGNQGVIIPEKNLKNLMLKQELVDSVREGKFHIWPISRVEEGIEILTGMKAGELQEDGTYPEGTLFRKVDDRLRELADIVKSFGEEEKKEKSKE